METNRGLKQCAFNLYDNVCGTLHTNPGTHSPSNVITHPPPIGKGSRRRHL